MITRIQPARQLLPQLLRAHARVRIASLTTSLPRNQVQDVSASASPQPTTPPTQPQPSSAPTSRRRSLLLLPIAFLCIGAILGTSARYLLSPPPPPIPGSPEDQAEKERLRRAASQLSIVRSLSADPAWTSWEAYTTFDASHRASHIMSGPLDGGAHAGGYQRIFHNAGTGEMVSVLHVGRGLVGWPWATHGGFVASVLDEHSGRAAFASWASLILPDSGSGAAPTGFTARLALHYKRPTWAGRFYVARARVLDDDELPEKERGKRHYKAFVDASLEDAETGKVCVTAETLYVGGMKTKKERRRRTKEEEDDIEKTRRAVLQGSLTRY